MKKGISIHITGIVQGVGFRPWVWKTAKKLGLSGTVRNNFDGVRVELFENPEPFLQHLEDHPPPLSRIDCIETTEIEYQNLSNFRILESDSSGEALQRISPDIAICDDCCRELFDPSDRRHRYPFINCVNCGPRFSIIQNLPYDRPQTSMHEFKMCPACRAEYTDPADRRYHAQPIACPECGPKMEICSVGSQSQSAHRADPTTWESVWQQAMQRGRIVAVKGIGGFHLACDALNADAVAALRKRKGREAKPFALMVPDLDWVKTVCTVSSEEEHLLHSRERPIVLLRLKSAFKTLEYVAPGLDSLGVMLPYSPMHEIMFDLFPYPVVMTSANYSSEPMIHTNEAARKKLAGIADVFLMHDREIINRCDDPVCAVHGEQTVVIRPGRGVAPVSMPIPASQASSLPGSKSRQDAGDTCILAFGADMKNAFALAHHGQTTLLPYVGDLENPETQNILEKSIDRELECFQLTPDLVLHDLHPDYFSTQMAQEFAGSCDIPSLGIQHHHAHLVGAYAGRAIGFAFDGTGYGIDGTIWGGEVLLYDDAGFERMLHLRPFALPGGELAVKQPQRILDSLFYQLDQLEDTPTKSLLQSGINCPMTSSMGRLFDAVSCMLGICRKPTFDGEAAMRMEAVADKTECGDLAFEIRDGQIDWRPLMLDLIEEKEKGVSVPVLAARFHNTLAEVVYCCGKLLAEKHGALPWVFAGGVFQNRLLVERIKSVVGEEFELIFSCYPNDSGIAIGQTIIGAKQWASK